LRNYIENEACGKADLTTWTNYWDPTAPQQYNGQDCGVFACKTAEIITRGGRLNFRPEEIANQRSRMIIEIANARLLKRGDDE
jgi:sentrin-specific protease 1